MSQHGAGLPRTTRYAHLSTEDHLAALDNDLDAADYNRELIIKSIEESAEARFQSMKKSLNWVLTTFVSLLVLVCGTLLAVVVRG